MKNTIYKIGFMLFALGLVTISCTSPEAETNYTPADYEFPTGITLTSGNITNSSFDFTYTINGGGEGYYVVVEGGSAAPSNEDVFDGTATGLVDSGNFVLDGTAVVTSVTEDLCDGTAYDVYAVQFTTDSFLSETTTKLTVSTVANSPIAGTYNAVTNGYNGWFGEDAVDFLGTVTITDNGGGSYSFDDLTGGWYAEYYSGYGATTVPGTFPSITCNDFARNFASPFYNCCGDVIVYSGIINFDGTITISWFNTFFEDDIVTMVLTKQ
jgi:hypothetical protein